MPWPRSHTQQCWRKDVCVCLVLKPVGGDRRLHLREEGWKARDPLAPTRGLARLLPSRSIARTAHWQDGGAMSQGTWASSPALGGEAAIPG